MRSTSIILVLSVVFLLHPGLILADTINIVPYEFKGEKPLQIGHNEFKSTLNGYLPGEWGERTGEIKRKNKETFVVDYEITALIFNIYPVAIDWLLSPPSESNITVPFFPGTGNGFDETISTLPTGMELVSASMEDPYGLIYVGGILPLSSIEDLPILGPNGEIYTWDLSRITPPEGPWFLVEVTMPLDNFTAIGPPEPATFTLLAIGTLLLRRNPRRRVA
jgi:hypothetical protein